MMQRCGSLVTRGTFMLDNVCKVIKHILSLFIGYVFAPVEY